MRFYLAASYLSAALADWVVPAFPNSNSNETVSIKTRKEPFVFEHVESNAINHARFGNTTESFYSSPVFELTTGEAWFSLPDVTVLKMPEPGVPYAVIAAKYDVVDASSGRSVPLSELYSHHWLVYDRLIGGDGFNIGCGGTGTWVSNIFGAGGEMRGIPYVYPDGFGFVIPGNRHWSANIHFIRTQDLDTEQYGGSLGNATKACIECEYARGKGLGCVPGLDGEAIFGCCFDGSRCPVNSPSNVSKKQYKLVYNVTWTTNVQHVKPLSTYVIDGFNCGVLGNLMPHKDAHATKCDDKMCKSEVTQRAPKSGIIEWAYTHQHAGAINTTLSINGVPACTSYPHIGTDAHEHPGNEKGYLVGFKMCVDPTVGNSIKVQKGDHLTLTAFASIDPADTRNLPLPGGSHRGFMNLFYFYMHELNDSDSYMCVGNQCVARPGGVPFKTCQLACGAGTIV